jgi:hypothetical protein
MEFVCPIPYAWPISCFAITSNSDELIEFPRAFVDMAMSTWAIKPLESKLICDSPGATNLMSFPADILDSPITLLRVTFDALEFVLMSMSALLSVTSWSFMFGIFEFHSSTAWCTACTTCGLASSSIL